jgi:hypothetical protein
MTPEELAQAIADHFRPPFSAEDYEYVLDENKKPVRDENGFRKVRYFTRDFRESVDGSTMITKRTWTEDGPDISIVPLTWREVAEAVLARYNVTPKDDTSEHLTN